MEAADRRKYIRIPYEAVLRYTSKGHKKKIFSDAASKNISSGGILMATKERFPAGTLLEVELDIPSLEGYSTVTITGQVMRSVESQGGKMHENGISICKIDKDDEGMLQQFLEFFPEMEIVEK